MEDQFDSLLDFGSSTGPSTTNGSTQQTHDPNDPFSSPSKQPDVNGTSKSHDQSNNPFGDDPFGLNTGQNSNFNDGGFETGDLLGGSLEAEFAAGISSIKTETTEVEVAQEENSHDQESHDLLAPETNNVQELESPLTPGTEEPSEGFSEEAGDYRDEQYENLRDDYREDQFEGYRTEPQQTTEELPEEYRQEEEEVNPEPQVEYQEPEPDYREPEQDHTEPEQEYREPEQEYREPEPEYREPEQEYREPEQEYREPEREYREPEPEYREPEQEYREPEPEYREPEQEYREPEQEYREPEPEYQEEPQTQVEYEDEPVAHHAEYHEEHQVEHVDYQEESHQEYEQESQPQDHEDYSPEEPYSPVRDEDNFLGQIEEIERMASQAPVSPVQEEVTSPSSDGGSITEHVSAHVTEDGDTTTTVTETVKEVHEGETHTENDQQEDEEEQQPLKMEQEENDVSYDDERRSSKSLIRAFEMEKQDYTPPKRVVKTETEKDSKSAVFIANSKEGSDQNTCVVCAKRVYEMEKLIANHAVYHKTCFKCTKCRSTLGVGTFYVCEANLYCKAHFHELFKLRGHYEDRHKNSKEASPVNGTGNGTVSIDEGANTPLPEVIRPSEDTREEEIQSLPSLRNIKSRFENRDEAPQKEVKQPGKIKVDWGTGDMRQKEVSPSPPRDPEIFREEKVQSQEEVSYGGLTSIKSRYLESTSTVAAPQGPPAPKVIPRAPEPVQKAPSVSPPREPGVVRSTDNKDETEELPPQNITRGLLARFRDMESQSGNQPIKTCPPPRTDLIEADLQVPERPEAGEFENNPQFRDDVIREDDDNETEHLPASGNLKSRLAVFKQMEATNVNTAGAPSFGNQYSTNRQSPSRMNGNPGNANSGEVLREGEGNPEEELPQVGSAKSMREKFQSMQQNEEAPAASGDRKAGHSFTPPRGSPEKQLAEVTSHVAKKDKNVTREDDPYKGETLPTQEILNSCLNHFRQMEEEAKEQKTREYSPGRKKSRDFSFVTEFHPEQNSAPKKPPRTASSSGPDKTVYNPSAPEGGEFENEPISRDDVVRESDNNEVHELPQEGQARKLREQYLAKAH